MPRQRRLAGSVEIAILWFKLGEAEKGLRYPDCTVTLALHSHEIIEQILSPPPAVLRVSICICEEKLHCRTCNGERTYIAGYGRKFAQCKGDASCTMSKAQESLTIGLSTVVFQGWPIAAGPVVSGWPDRANEEVTNHLRLVQIYAFVSLARAAREIAGSLPTVE